MIRLILFSALCFFYESAPVFAHHPWDGRTLTRWYQGLASGVAHPVLGPDHLAFLVAVAVFCVLFSGGFRVLAVFVPATLLGLAAYLAQASPSASAYETAVVLSVIAAGVFLLSGARKFFAALCLAGVAGLFHGFAYGSGIVGAEPSPLVFYLIGIAAVQTGLVIAVAFVLGRVRALFPDDGAGFARAAGITLVAAGAAMGYSSVLL